MRQLTDRAGAQFTAMSIKECKAPDGQISSRERPKKPNLSQIPCRGIAHHETSITRSIHGGKRKKKRSAEKDERSSQLRTVPLDRLAACDAGQDEEEEEEKERADGQEPGGGGGGGHGRVGKLRLRARMDSSGARRGRPYEREREKRRGGRWRRGGGRVGDGSAGEGSGVEWSGRMGTRTPPAQPHAH